MALLEVALAEPLVHRGQLAAKDRHEEVARPARRLEKASVDPLRLALDEVEHGLDHPCGVNTSPWSATRCRDLTRLTCSGFSRLGSTVVRSSTAPSYAADP